MNAELFDNNYSIYNNINISDNFSHSGEIYTHLSNTYGTFAPDGEIRRRQWLNKNQEDGDESDPYWKNPLLTFASYTKTEKGGGSWIVHYSNIANYCIKRFAVLNVRDRCFIYDNNEGIYRENNRDIESTIKLGLDACGYAKSKPIGPIVTDVMKRIMDTNRCSEDPFNRRSDLIPCNNGAYNIRTKQLEPYSPLHGFTYKYPTNYNPDADIRPILDYIRGLVKEEDLRLILQMLSSVVMRDHHKRLYLIYNLSGNNGKSTFLNLIEATIGGKNVSHLSPQAITNGPFNSAALDGKVANIASDIEDKAIYDTAIIKQLTGNDPIHAQRKYGQPYNFVFRGVCVWGCNTPPRINDDTDAFNRRVVLIEFPNQFAQDSTFADEFLSDSMNHEALLKIAIDHVPYLLESGVIDTDVEATRYELKMKSDPVFAFIEERMERDERYVFADPDPDTSEIHDSSINLEYIHSQYIDYCREAKVKRTLGINAFKKALGNYSRYSVHVKYKGSSGNQTAIVKGARLRTRTVDVTNAPLDKFVACPQ